MQVSTALHALRQSARFFERWSGGVAPLSWASSSFCSPAGQDDQQVSCSSEGQHLRIGLAAPPGHLAPQQPAPPPTCRPASAQHLPHSRLLWPHKLGSSLTHPSTLPPARGLACSPAHTEPRRLQGLQPPHAQRGLFQGFGGGFNSQDYFGFHRQATNALIALNVAVFIASNLDPRLVPAFAQHNYAISFKGEGYRLLSAAFLHSGPLHLLTNMLALHWLGPPVEEACGRACFTAIYLCGALGGGALHYQYGALHSLGLGASGAIAGLFGAFIVYKLRNRSFVPLTSYDVSWVAQVVGLNVLLAMLTGGSIGHWSHLGGLLGGAAGMFLLGPRYAWGPSGYIENRPLLPFFRNGSRF
mmetsp:Transcript_8992/g.19300  ORF Transcript_8992/g.19300 Transcript_8992/m.19300 type:complete len:357 (+) Transcript_8992:30-1100(+)